VLVGGEGTRLRPLTLSMPKQMLPVVDRPMIERVVGQLGRHGVEEAVLSLGYMPGAFERAYPDGVVDGVRVFYAVEPEPLDTAGAIRFAAEAAGLCERFIAVNGDVLTDIDLGALVEFHERSGAEGTIALHPVDNPSAFGVVPTDEHGRVTAFVEKPQGDAPTDLINAGAYVLEPSVLERIAAGQRVSIEREVFPSMVEKGSLYALADASYWLDTGTPEAYLAAHFDILEGKRAWIIPPAPGARLVEQGVWVIGSADVRGDVRGPTLLGDGAAVAAGALVHRCAVGARCVVETGASLTDAVVMHDVTVSSGAVVDRSIVGARAVLGEGCEVRSVSVVGFDAAVPPQDVLDGARVGP
jgi:mannose-1-phosphate guanylyltransferase